MVDIALSTNYSVFHINLIQFFLQLDCIRAADFDQDRD